MQTATVNFSRIDFNGPRGIASFLMGRVRSYPNLITHTAAEKIAGYLSNVPAQTQNNPNLTAIARIIEGLGTIKTGKLPGPAARVAADELGLVFVATEKRTFKLALSEEADEIGSRIIDAEHAIKSHLEVAAMHKACMAIRQLTEQNPSFLAGEVEGIRWAPKNPDSGFFAAKPSVERLGEDLPTAILPPVQMSASVVIYGTGNACGIVWPRSVLFREAPYELSGMKSYSFEKTGAGWLKKGTQTIEEALLYMGFTGPQRRPVLEIFAPVPAPLQGARAEEQFVPRGLVELESFESGKYALITIIENKAQSDVIGISRGEKAHIMGDQGLIGGVKQRTFLKFEYVPMMTEKREQETRSQQRGNIVVIAVPVVEMPTFHGFGGSIFDDFRGGSGMKSFSGPTTFRSRGAELGPTHIGTDRATATGVSLGDSVSVSIDHNRSCGLFRIIPIGVSADVDVSTFQARVISLADYRTQKAG